jgi:hypothetical protein
MVHVYVLEYTCTYSSTIWYSSTMVHVYVLEYHLVLEYTCTMVRIRVLEYHGIRVRTRIRVVRTYYVRTYHDTILVRTRVQCTMVHVYQWYTCTQSVRTRVPLWYVWHNHYGNIAIQKNGRDAASTWYLSKLAQQGSTSNVWKRYHFLYEHYGRGRGLKVTVK